MAFAARTAISGTGHLCLVKASFSDDPEFSPKKRAGALEKGPHPRVIPGRTGRDSTRYVENGGIITIETDRNWCFQVVLYGGWLWATIYILSVI